MPSDEAEENILKSADSTPKRPRAKKVLTVIELIEQGTRRLENHRKSLARESFTKAIALDPNSEVAWLGLAAAAATEADAHAAFLRVREINPDNAATQRYFARIAENERIRAEQQAFHARLQEQNRATLAASQARIAARQQSQRTARWVLSALLVLAVLGLWAIARSSASRPSTTSNFTMPVATPIGIATPIRVAPSFSGGSLCADGTHSAAVGRGACSHHGGVVGH